MRPIACDEPMVDWELEQTLNAQADEVLAGGARDGSLPCFVELVDRYEARLFNFLLRRTSSAEDAEDITQEAFLRAWRSLQRYDASRPFTTWLFCIANRLAIDHHRNGQRRPSRAIDINVDHLRRTDDDPTRDVADGEEASNIWLLVDAVLTPEQRAALWLKYAEGVSIQEIARVMSKTPGAVRVLLHRARITLAGHVESDAPSTRWSRTRLAADC
jgi:RNA polymerase sigma-70 factor (ECF subfamily)